MVWAPANTFLFINPSPIGRILGTGDDSIRVIYLKQLRKTSAAVWFCLDLIPLKSIPQTEYIVLPYNIRRLHCGYLLMAEFCAVKNGPFKTMPIQHRTNRSEFKSSTPLKLRVDELLSKWLRLEKLSGQNDCRDPYSIDDTTNEHYPNR